MSDANETELMKQVRQASSREELAYFRQYFIGMTDAPRTVWSISLPDDYQDLDEDGEVYHHYEGYTAFMVVARTAEEALLLARISAGYSSRAVSFMNVERVDMSVSAVVLSQWTQMG